MADDTPLPDRGHEALRQSILATLADLQQTAADTTDGLTLTDILFELIDSIYGDISALNIRADAAEIRANTAQDGIDALQQRVAQLENPLAP